MVVRHGGTQVGSAAQQRGGGCSPLRPCLQAPPRGGQRRRLFGPSRRRSAAPARRRVRLRNRTAALCAASMRSPVQAPPAAQVREQTHRSGRGVDPSCGGNGPRLRRVRRPLQACDPGRSAPGEMESQLSTPLSTTALALRCLTASSAAQRSEFVSRRCGREHRMAAHRFQNAELADAGGSPVHLYAVETSFSQRGIRQVCSPELRPARLLKVVTASGGRPVSGEQLARSSSGTDDRAPAADLQGRLGLRPSPPASQAGEAGKLERRRACGWSSASAARQPARDVDRIAMCRGTRVGGSAAAPAHGRANGTWRPSAPGSWLRKAVGLGGLRRRDPGPGAAGGPGRARGGLQKPRSSNGAGLTARQAHICTGFGGRSLSSLGRCRRRGARDSSSLGC